MSEISLVQTYVPTIFLRVGQEISSPVWGWLQKHWWVIAMVVAVIILGLVFIKKAKPKVELIKEETLPNVKIDPFNKLYPPTST